MEFRPRVRRKVLINITSLIDVLFLLLIFFMVSSTFLEQPGIRLELPDARSAVVTEQRDYILYVDPEGRMFLNEEEVDTETLGDRLKEALPAMREGALILKADRRVPHGDIVRVMDISRQSGVRRLIIGTRPEEAAQPPAGPARSVIR
jgi:biopolymer transport protein ExbD